MIKIFADANPVKRGFLTRRLRKITQKWLDSDPHSVPAMCSYYRNEMWTGFASVFSANFDPHDLFFQFAEVNEQVNENLDRNFNFPFNNFSRGGDDEFYAAPHRAGWQHVKNYFDEDFPGTNPLRREFCEWVVKNL